MPYVYKYTDKNDGIVKYVGIIRAESNFPRRFKQHEYDSWYSSSEWKIEYFETPTICDAEALEGHFIDIYGTSEWFNKAKSTWGRLSFVPEVEWTEYAENKEDRKKHWEIGNRLQQVETELDCCLSTFHKLESKIDHIMHVRADLIKDVKKQERRDIRDWFYKYFVFTLKDGYWATSEWLYEHYIDNTATTSTWFEDVSEFWDAMLDCSDISMHIHGDKICSIWLKDSSEYEAYTEKKRSDFDTFLSGLNQLASGSEM